MKMEKEKGKKKKRIAAMFIVSLTIILAGCGQQESASDPLATVNGVGITQSDLDQYLPFFMSMFGGTAEQATDEIKVQVLDALVTMEVLKQHYADIKDEVLPETLEADFQTYLDGIKSDENNQKFLTDNNISEEFLESLFTDQNYMGYFLEETQEKTLAKEEEAQAMYEENKENYYEVRASHILVPLTGSALATEVLEKAENGDDFTELSDEYSIDTAAKANGGDLGYFRKGRMVKPFEDAAFAMEIGEIDGPIETDYGYHIIKVMDKRYAPFEELFLQEGEIYRAIFEEIYNEEMDVIKADMDIIYEE